MEELNLRRVDTGVDVGVGPTLGNPTHVRAQSKAIMSWELSLLVELWGHHLRNISSSMVRGDPDWADSNKAHFSPSFPHRKCGRNPRHCCHK